MGVSTAEKRQVFRQLHKSGCFVIPNPWDVGSARMLAHAGFKAVASTSAGFAWTIGKADGDAPLEAVLHHLKDLAAGVDIPVNADFEDGFAVEPAAMSINVMRAAATGIAGLSIEDSTGDPARPLFDFDFAVKRITAARAAIDNSASGGEPVFLTARSEGFIAGRPDLAETIRRLVAFAEAGADCLFAPGIREPAQISAIVRAVAPKPVNLILAKSGMSVAEAAALGVRRISTGGALARAALGEFMRAAREIADTGTFDALDRGLSTADIHNALQ